MKNIVIIDYNLGNIKSIVNAFQNFKIELTISDKKEEILNADALILPGVGSFSQGMKNLKEKDLIETIQEYSKTGKPLLGICLGMQLLFSKSFEFGESDGLDIIKGSVEKLDVPKNTKLPHISWNEIYQNNKWEDTIFNGLDEYSNVYFVHSYACNPINKDLVLSYTNYFGVEFCSSVNKGQIYGCQFHPEKSSKVGLLIIENFIKLAGLNNE